MENLKKYKVSLEGAEDGICIWAIGPKEAICGVFRDLKPIIVDECYSGVVEADGGNDDYFSFSVVARNARGFLCWKVNLEFSVLWTGN